MAIVYAIPFRFRTVIFGFHKMDAGRSPKTRAPARTILTLNQYSRVASPIQIDIHIRFIAFPAAGREIRHIN